MKLIVCTVVFFLNSFLLRTNTKECKYLEIYLMSSFRNDSINLRTEKSNNESFRLNTQLSLGQAKSCYFIMTEKDSTIYIRDVINRNFDSVKYQPKYPYLYIYYSRPKFTFRYSQKLWFLE